MIVVDASAAIAALLHVGPARAALRRETLHALHLIDSETAHSLRRRVLAEELSARQGAEALAVWRRVALSRHPTVDLLPRVWELRENLSAYDEGYVALAERLGCALLTADARLARAPGVRCAITVVPA